MNPIDLDIDMLRCVIEVIRTGSFTRAGEKIGLTQSGVSLKIRRLEERLDSRIINRTSKSISLTTDGESLFFYAKRILALHDEAVSKLTQPKASGSLRVGLIDYFIPDALPKILGKFRAQYPNIHLEIHTGMGMHLLPLYEKKELDLVVTGRESYQGSDRVLTQEPLVWVYGGDFDFSIQQPVPLALLPSPCSFRSLATHGLERAGINWEVLYTGTSIANIQTAVEAGMGFSVLPMGALTKAMKRVPSHLGFPPLPMYSIFLLADSQEVNDARDLFVSYLEDELFSLK